MRPPSGYLRPMSQITSPPAIMAAIQSAMRAVDVSAGGIGLSSLTGLVEARAEHAVAVRGQAGDERPHQGGRKLVCETPNACAGDTERLRWRRRTPALEALTPARANPTPDNGSCRW